MLPKQVLVDDLQHQHAIMIVHFNELRARMIILMRTVERQGAELTKLRRAVERQRKREERRYQRAWEKSIGANVSPESKGRVS